MAVDQFWRTFRPFNRLFGRRSYFYIPAFTYNVNWLGASEVITQFNYEASRNFILPRRLVAPAGVNYCPCIRWHDGNNNVQRYKLWENVGEVLNTPLITPGNKIGANFVVEIWSVEGAATVSNDDALQIFTGIVQSITDYHTSTDVEESTSVLVPRSELINANANSLVYASPLAIATAMGGIDILGWYDASNTGSSPGFLAQWNDLSGHNRHLLQAVGARQPELIDNSFGTAPFTKPSVTFISESFMEANAIVMAESVYIVMQVVSQDVVNLYRSGAGVSWETKFNATLGRFDVKKYATTPITLNVDYQAPIQPFLLIFANANRSGSPVYSLVASTGPYVMDYNNAVNIGASRVGEAQSSKFQIGDTAVSGVEYAIAEIIITDQSYDAFNNPAAFDQALRRYLANKYQGLMEVPLRFGSSAVAEPTTT